MLDPSIAEHYQSGYERSRLFPGGHPRLEFVRSLELLGRLLPAPPARVLDVGGGAGHLRGPPGRGRLPGASGSTPCPCMSGRRRRPAAPLRTGQRRPASYGPRSYGPGGTAEDSPAPGSVASSFTASVGDARRLEQPDESQDAVVLFGPLYHLTSADDRGQALAEAHRVLRPGGRLMAMAISRCASLLDGLYRDWLDDPVFRPIVTGIWPTGSTVTRIPPDGPSSSPRPTSTARRASPKRSARADSMRSRSTGWRARGGRWTGNGPIPGGMSRSCSRPGRSKPTLPSLASATISSRHRQPALG